MVKQIRLTHGKVALVDDVDFGWLSQYSWSAFQFDERSSWYAAANIKQSDGKWKLFKMHRLVMNAAPRVQVDHRNRDGLDNRRCNLRLATNSQNQQNRTKKLGGTSRFKGVRFESGKWRAQIGVGGKTRHLGFFVDEEEAARAYDAAAVEHFGEFARVNFPE